VRRPTNKQAVGRSLSLDQTVWNSLPDELKDETENILRQSLKTLLFRQYQRAQRIKGSLRRCSI